VCITGPAFGSFTQGTILAVAGLDGMSQFLTATPDTLGNADTETLSAANTS
jgi:hypothetical protein